MMTEEDAKLVALAALHGAKFGRRARGYWVALGDGSYISPTKCTIARASAHYLEDHGLMSHEDMLGYMIKTQHICTRGAQDIDPAWVSQVLA